MDRLNVLKCDPSWYSHVNNQEYELFIVHFGWQWHILTLTQNLELWLGMDIPPYTKEIFTLHS
jgi:hypothetical protein